MYSVVVNGKVLDMRWKRCKEAPYIHFFYLGDILIGQVFKSEKYWSCVSQKHVNDLCPVHGFKDRYWASEFLLKINGYCPK
jgi:hypothetical protein